MAHKYEADAERFKARLDQIGVAHDSAQVAFALDISQSHAANMLCGRKGFTAPMQEKIDAIAAKANGSPPEMVEQVEVDLPPVGISEAIRGDHRELRYQVWAGFGKNRIIEVIAVVHDPDQARRLCDLLNKEAG